MVRQKFLFLWSLLASVGAWVKREINEILAESEKGDGISKAGRCDVE